MNRLYDRAGRRVSPSTLLASAIVLLFAVGACADDGCGGAVPGGQDAVADAVEDRSANVPEDLTPVIDGRVIITSDQSIPVMLDQGVIQDLVRDDTSSKFCISTSDAGVRPYGQYCSGKPRCYDQCTDHVWVTSDPCYLPSGDVCVFDCSQCP